MLVIVDRYRVDCKSPTFSLRYNYDELFMIIPDGILYSYSDCSPHLPIHRLGIQHLINGVHRCMCQLGANMHYNNASMSLLG